MKEVIRWTRYSCTLPGVTLFRGRLPKKRYEMEPEPDGVALRPFVAALSFGNDPVFLDELIGCLFEGGAGIKHPDPLLGREGEEPVLGDLGGLLEGFLRWC